MRNHKQTSQVLVGMGSKLVSLLSLVSCWLNCIAVNAGNEPSIMLLVLRFQVSKIYSESKMMYKVLNAQLWSFDTEKIQTHESNSEEASQAVVLSSSL